MQLWTTNAVVAAFGFVTPLAFARLAAPEEYGRFSLVTSVLAIAGAATLPGLNISLTQAAARGYHGALASVVRTRLRWALAPALAILATGGWMLATGDPVTGALLACLAPLFPLIYGADVAQSFMNGTQRFAALSAWMFAAAAVPSAVVLSLLGAGAGAPAAVVGYFIALAAVNAASYAWAATRYISNDRLDPGTIAYGKRLTVITSLGTLQSYLDKVAVGGILGLNALAIYSVGKLFQQALKMTWGALHQLYFPKLASRSLDAARHLTRATLPLIWAGFGVVALVLVLIAPAVIDAVFGAAYASSVDVSRILILGVAVAIPGAQFEILFRSTGDERRLYVQRITFAAAELLFVTVGALTFGLRGAVWGAVLAYGLNSVQGFLLDLRR
jgi:O-antigen/teichoic acid export membrane protein